MNFDLTQVPFSRYGSYIAISRPQPKGNPAGDLLIRNVHGGSVQSASFAISLRRGGRNIRFDEQASASCLRLFAGDAAVEFCIDDANTLRIRGRGAALRLSMATTISDNAIPYGQGMWQINRRSGMIKYMLVSMRGRMKVTAPWREKACTEIQIDISGDADGVFEAALEEFSGGYDSRPRYKAFDKCVADVTADFDRWLARMPETPPRYAKARKLAAYVMWSCVVPPGGNLPRPAMLMSKNHMNRLYSWDYLFNAMALSRGHNRLAWDQFMLMADVQSPQGHFPDFVSDAHWQWNYVKPPIQGWALRWMMRRCRWITRGHVRQAYDLLAAWTDWWFKYRDSDGDGIPQYDHGNDSGWDNATVFDIRPPIESPDLSAYLAVQMDVLAELAEKLHRPRKAAYWRRRADELCGKLIEHSWRGDGFVAPQSQTHETAAQGDSLILLLPLVLGDRLTPEIRDKMLTGLKRRGRFITPHGPATENPASPLYKSNGYWRGPIWAPSTMVLVDSLKNLHQDRLARTIARRFCDTCAASGMAENFDALTGAGLRDRAYTWTAAVFLILAHEYLQ